MQPMNTLIKSITLTSLTLITPLICNAQETADSTAKTAKEMNDIKAGWHNLLEGDKLDQWRSWRKGIENVTAWTVKDGVLHLNKSEGRAKYGGSLITLKQYPNFEFKFEFKISKGGNSGIKYRSLDNLGLEYQILDDGAAKDGKNPKNRVASLYQLVAAPDDKPIKPAGEWNTGRIIANGNNIQQWFNGVKMVEIEIGSEEWKAAFADSKYKDKKDFAKQSAEILIQDHGDEVSYRNLFIKELK